MRDDAILQRFAELRWAPEPRTPDIEVCIPADGKDIAMDELTLNLGTALERIAEALDLPMPGLGVRVDPTLGEGTYEVRAQGRTRLVGRLGVPSGVWWRRHRSAGPLGRAGVVSMPPDLDAPLRPEDLLVRAAEAVAWSDPSDIDRLTDQRVRELMPEGVETTAEDLPLWRDAIQELLRARVSPAGVRGLEPGGDGNHALEPSAPRLADGLERPSNALRLGKELFAKLSPADDEPMPVEQQISNVVDWIWSTVGVACTPGPAPLLDEDLPAWGFEVVIHGLPRAAGEIPEPADPPQQWIDPTTGARVDAPRRDDAESIEAMLAAQVCACLEEAATEFVDVAAVEEHLDQLAERRAELVDVVRDRVPEDLLATALARIVDERRSLRGASILERLVEAGERPAVELVVDAAEQDAALRWLDDWRDVSGLVELVRTAAPLTGRPAWSVTLDPASIARLRASMQDGDDADTVASVLREIDEAATSHPDGDGALVVPLDLRPAVDRLVRAQLPMLHVLTAHESVEVQVEDDRLS